MDRVILAKQVENKPFYENLYKSLLVTPISTIF